MTQPELQVRLLSYEELNPDLISAWELLGERALEPNAYLSPCFAIPALRHLCGETDLSNTASLLVGRPNP